MRRRDFIAAAGGFLLAGPVARAQGTSTAARIAVLDWDPEATSRLESFRKTLRELGWVEGQNLVVDYRFAAGRTDRADALAAEIARSRVSVIVAFATPAAHAVKRATSTIPIVITSADPVASGLVSNIARPGGNITGISNMMPDLEAKRMGLLQELFPGLKRVAFLGSRPDPATPGFVRQAQAAAQRHGVRVDPVLIATPDEVDTAMTTMQANKAEAVIVQPLFVLNASSAGQVAEIARRRGLPTITNFALYPRAGGLLSYGPESEFGRQAAARYVDRILRGAAPGDLPIEQPTRFELVINLKTAKALGVKVSPALLTRADEVIG